MQTFRMRPRDVLAENLKKLMAATPELNTFPQITKAGGGSNGTLDRIRRKTLATSIDNLDPLARVYGLEPWQLLVPTLTAKRGTNGKPRVSGMPDWPFSRVSLSRYTNLEPEDRVYVEAKLESAIENTEVKPVDSSSVTPYSDATASTDGAGPDAVKAGSGQKKVSRFAPDVPGPDGGSTDDRSHESGGLPRERRNRSR
jgi:hypothetical protein